MTKRLWCVTISSSRHFCACLRADNAAAGNDFRRSLSFLAPNGAIICARSRKKRLSFCSRDTHLATQRVAAMNDGESWRRLDNFSRRADEKGFCLALFFAYSKRKRRCGGAFLLLEGLFAPVGRSNCSRCAKFSFSQRSVLERARSRFPF